MKRYYYLAGKLLAVVITALLMYETADTGVLLIRILVLGCLFSLQQLLELVNKGKYVKWCSLCNVAVLTVAFFIGLSETFAIGTVVGIELIDTFVNGTQFYKIEMAYLLLLWFVYRPGMIVMMFTIILVIMLLLLRFADERWQALWNADLEQKVKFQQLENKLQGMKEYAKTVESTAVMEERNRFASRIHDQLGHSISGSIILLEATALSLEKDPESAKKNVILVTENLRRGVDDIRMALRQERPLRDRVGTNEIKKELERFRVTYEKDAVLETEGDLRKISILVWRCISDNLKEALTNMLKHSSGNCFTIKIICLNKIIRVEYHDNGTSLEEIRPGIGLSSIEERTAACNGTTIFTGGPTGFRIVTIFY